MIESQFSDPPHSSGQAIGELFLGQAYRIKRETSKGDEAIRMKRKTMEQVIVSCSTESRVFPRESANDALVYSITVHGFKEIFGAGHAGLFVPVNKPKTFIPPAEIVAVLPNLVRE